MGTNNKYKLICKTPASFWQAMWREALPVGNGIIGASVYGAVGDETVMLCHEDLWHNGVNETLPDISEYLEKTRALLLANKPAEARDIMTNALKDSGYKGQMASPFPLGDLNITQKAASAFKNYRRALDMSIGEVSVEWNDGPTRFTRCVFASRSDEIIAVQLKKEGPGKIEADIGLSIHSLEDAKPTAGRLDAPTPAIPDHIESKAEDNWLFYAAQNDDGTDHGAVAWVSGVGNISTEGDILRVEGGESILVLVKLFVKQSRTEAWKEMQAELSAITDSYAKLLQNHGKIHTELFHKVHLDLGGDEESLQSLDGNVPAHDLSNEELLLKSYGGEMPTAMTEKMWAYGRYLLISSSREGSLPCPLIGLWTGEYGTMWGFNMANENLQMIYWQAGTGNLTETIPAVFDYYDSMMDDFRHNAQALYGCRGIYVPATTAPGSGYLQVISHHILHWTGAAGWLSQHYYDYFLYTQDEEFLRNRALPFMAETALFYEDFLIEDDDGYLMSLPSNSPENTPGNHWKGRGMGAAMETTINATMDFAIIKELLTNLVRSAQLTGSYHDRIETWKEMLKKIPPYQINDDKAIREWMHPFFDDNYHHRHQSHAYPIFPGTELIEEDDPELFSAFVTAIKKRLVIGLKEQSGWSLVHMANNYARMTEPELALECLETLARSCVINNFYTFHNDWRRMGICVELPWAPVQIDANMGWTAAVQEMLLYSRQGILKLLPALPAKWRKGSFENFLGRGGISISCSWDMKEGTLSSEIISLKEQTINLKLPVVPKEILCNVALRSADTILYKDQYSELTLPVKEKVVLRARF